MRNEELQHIIFLAPIYGRDYLVHEHYNCVSYSVRNISLGSRRGTAEMTKTINPKPQTPQRIEMRRSLSLWCKEKHKSVDRVGCRMFLFSLTQLDTSQVRILFIIINMHDETYVKTEGPNSIS